MAERGGNAIGATPSGLDLPEPVQRYLERSLPRHRPAPLQVRISQQGQMWQKRGGRAMRFNAVQHFAVDRVAFSWRARFPIVGPIAIKVVDDYAGGDGKLEARVLAFPVQRQEGPETVKGEALRYLAELPWVPYAMAHNSELEWRQVDERIVEVATQVGGERLAVSMEFGATGDIRRMSSQMRQLKLENRWVATPWAGEFGEYEVLGGVRIPASAEVYWDLESGRFVYWRGRVTSAELLDEPFQR